MPDNPGFLGCRANCRLTVPLGPGNHAAILAKVKVRPYPGNPGPPLSLPLSLILRTSAMIMNKSQMHAKLSITLKAEAIEVEQTALIFSLSVPGTNLHRA